ncbi:MAG: hypothetical protein R3293_13520 [Candidatus Promineifilaceae bacterium]|nr:hypothetical protein [Candidatus Promineifilaceae bacterium]
MFEVNGEYANRKGKYTVIAIDGPVMNVRYEDGTHAELKINIQQRIWENIVAEQELASAKSAARKSKSQGGQVTTRHFIKVVSIPPGEELTFPGWEERVVMANDQEVQMIKKGDRLIYFAQEAATFFAVATVTGDVFQADPKKYTFMLEDKTANFFQIDIDTETGNLGHGVTLDSIELESCPGFPDKDVAVEAFCVVSEDDFELLSEALTELSEEDLEDDDLDDEDDLEDEEEDD